MDTIQFKQSNIKFTDATGERGYVEGYASTFGNTDRDGDIIQKGAFDKTVRTHLDNETMPAMLFNHQFAEVIGEWSDMDVDGKGLFMKGMLWVEGNKLARDPVEKAKQARNMLQSKSMRGFSIGFIPKNSDRIETGRSILEVELFENSIVTIPANPQALPTDVKGFDPDLEREIEKYLKSEGLTRSKAREFIAKFYKGNVRDAVTTVERDADEQKEAIKKLHQAFFPQGVQ